MSDERLRQLEAAAWREWEESWGNTESGAHYSGFTAGYRVAEADLTAELAAVTAGRDAEVARLVEAAQAYIDAYDAALKAPLQYAQAEEYCHAQRYNLRAALAARGGEA